jgi:hypothetical protein
MAKQAMDVHKLTLQHNDIHFTSLASGATWKGHQCPRSRSEPAKECVEALDAPEGDLVKQQRAAVATGSSPLTSYSPSEPRCPLVWCQFPQTIHRSPPNRGGGRAIRERTLDVSARNTRSAIRTNIPIRFRRCWLLVKLLPEPTAQFASARYWKSWRPGPEKLSLTPPWVPAGTQWRSLGEFSRVAGSSVSTSTPLSCPQPNSACALRVSSRC